MNEIKNLGPVIGVDYVLNLSPHFDIGGFYEQNWMSITDGVNASMAVMGALMRYYFTGSTHSSPFVALKAGEAQISTGGSTSTKIGYGGEIGYRIGLSPLFSVSPKIETFSSPNQLATDFAIAVALHF